MPSIIGMNIRKITAERKVSASRGGIDINTQPKITDVRETKLQGLSKDDISALSVSFSMTSSFEPDAGSILIAGTILYKSDNMDAALKEWKKAKSLPPVDGVLLLNHILSKVAIIGLYLADILSLPPIIAFPKVESKEKYGDKISSAAIPAHEKK